MRTIKIAPSIISADFGNLAEQIKSAEDAGAAIIHFDVMDGHFVPNITMGPLVLRAVRDKTNLLFDAHLMITEPIRYVDRFVEAGGDIITVHAEACKDIRATIAEIKKLDAKVGVALNPETHLSSIDDIITQLDYILIMSVNPGFSGQKFMPQVLPKIAAASKMVLERNLPIEIGVDGGINAATIRKVLEAGATIIVAASAVFNKEKSVAASMALLKAEISKFKASKNA